MKEHTIKLRDLKGRWSVVTGASSGIGLAFTRLLASIGSHIVMVSNQPLELETYSKELLSQYPDIKIVTLNLDLSASSAASALLEQLSTLKITPLLFINNAGVFDFQSIGRLSEKRINLYIDLHIRTVTLLTRSVAILMEKAGGGYILNMSSMSCWMPVPGIAMYSATKSYIHALSRSMHSEYHSKGVGITVACPGGIATDLFGLPRKLQKLGVALGALVTPEHFVRKALKRTLRCKAQYINGLFNRIAIVLVSCVPEWGRDLFQRKVLDKHF